MHYSFLMTRSLHVMPRCPIFSSIRGQTFSFLWSGSKFKVHIGKKRDAKTLFYFCHSRDKFFSIFFKRSQPLNKNICNGTQEQLYDNIGNDSCM